MGKVMAGITTSIDGYITGPNDGPGHGLGDERLHTWVFGQPWTYESLPQSEATGEDKAWLDQAMASRRGRRRALDVRGVRALGGQNPWGVPFYIVTHRPEEQPEGDAFRFVSGVAEAIEQAKAATGEKHVHLMGGADVIRQGAGRRPRR